MGTTPNFALPYPELSDPADVPADMQELATAVDTKLGLAIPKGVVDAKGDLIAATGNDAVTRVPLGTAGQVLTADPAVAAGVKWAAAAGGGGGPQKRRYPIDIRNPQQAANAGNVFPSVFTFTAWEIWRWTFRADVDGRAYGVCMVPPSLSSPPNASIVLLVYFSGGNSRLSVGYAFVPPGGSLNPASLTAAASQDVTPPAADSTKEVTFALATAPVAGSLLIASIYHEGAHANDTATAHTQLVAAYLEVDAA